MTQFRVAQSVPRTACSSNDLSINLTISYAYICYPSPDYVAYKLLRKVVSVGLSAARIGSSLGPQSSLRVLFELRPWSVKREGVCINGNFR